MSLGTPIPGCQSVSFSQDGKKLAFIFVDGTIFLFDVETQKIIGQPLTGFEANVSSLSFNIDFNIDGNMLASGSQDNTIILWNLKTQKPIGLPLTGHKA